MSGLASERAEQRKLNDEELRDPSRNFTACSTSNREALLTTRRRTHSLVQAIHRHGTVNWPYSRVWGDPTFPQRLSGRRFSELGVAFTGMRALIRSALREFTRARCCSVPPASSLHALAESCRCLRLTVASNRLCKGPAPSVDHSCSTYPVALLAPSRPPKLVLSLLIRTS